MPATATLLAQLERCGWQADSQWSDEQWTLATSQGPRRAHAWGRVSEAGGRMLVVRLAELNLPGERELYARFLDFPLEVRLVIELGRQRYDAPWLLLITDASAELLRLPSEISELTVSGSVQLEGTLLPVLTTLARHPEGSQLTQPHRLEGAESLRDWLRHWAIQLAGVLDAAPEPCERMLWKWVIALQASRQHATVPRDDTWGIETKVQSGDFEVRYQSLSTVEQLALQLDAFDATITTRLFDGESAQQHEWLEALSTTSLLEQLRAELLMHGRYRFEAATVAWIFADLDQEQKGWRQEIVGLTPLRELLDHNGWHVYRPLACEVERWGLGAALRDAERLATYWRDRDIYLRQRRESGAEPQPVWGQPDLFCKPPTGIDAQGLLYDGINFLYGESLRLENLSPERRFGVGVTFLLLSLGLTTRMGWPWRGVQTLDKLWG